MTASRGGVPSPRAARSAPYKDGCGAVSEHYLRPFALRKLFGVRRGTVLAGNPRAHVGVWRVLAASRWWLTKQSPLMREPLMRGEAGEGLQFVADGAFDNRYVEFRGRAFRRRRVKSRVRIPPGVEVLRGCLEAFGC